MTMKSLFKFTVGQEAEISTGKLTRRVTVESRIPCEPVPFYRVRDRLGVACVSEFELAGVGK
jgi:hypothetical protein